MRNRPKNSGGMQALFAVYIFPINYLFSCCQPVHFIPIFLPVACTSLHPAITSGEILVWVFKIQTNVVVEGKKVQPKSGLLCKCCTPPSHNKVLWCGVISRFHFYGLFVQIFFLPPSAQCHIAPETEERLSLLGFCGASALPPTKLTGYVDVGQYVWCILLQSDFLGERFDGRLNFPLSLPSPYTHAAHFAGFFMDSWCG